MPIIGSIADDLTGGTTTGVLLARSKIRAGVLFSAAALSSVEGIREMDAVIVSSNSRPLPAAEASHIITEATIALKDIGVKYFQKRIDTTLRGGVGIEIDAMLDQLGDDTVAVVVPSMPESRRILVGGYSIIDGVALIRTPAANDVRTPVHENYIPRLIQNQSSRKVGFVALDKVLAGSSAIEEQLKKEREAGCQIIVVDAITLEDVSEIAKACIDLDWDVLSVDPGPFTAKLAFYRGIIQEEEPNIPPLVEENNKTVIVAAGSATPVTKKQMSVLCHEDRHVRISLDQIALINGGEEAVNEMLRAVNLAANLIEREIPPRAILFETALHGSLLNLDEEDDKRNYKHGTCAENINYGLGIIVQHLLEKVGRDKIAGLYCTGGDTMVSVCKCLDAEGIEALDYLIAQTDIGRLIGSPYDGLPIIGKGGLTGNDHIACDIVTRLFQESERYLLKTN